MTLNYKAIFTVLGITALAFIFYNSYKSCNPINVIGQKIINLDVKTPTVKEKDLAPPNHRVIGVVTPAKNKDSRFVRTDTKVIISVDNKCNTCIAATQVNNTKTFIGFSFEPKVYAGVANKGFLLGYSQGFFRWGHVSTDLILGFPGFGLGLSYNITNNFGLTLAGVFQYLNYTSISDIDSYSFSSDMSTIRPSLGLSFNLF